MKMMKNLCIFVGDENEEFMYKLCMRLKEENIQK